MLVCPEARWASAIAALPGAQTEDQQGQVGQEGGVVGEGRQPFPPHINRLDRGFWIIYIYMPRIIYMYTYICRIYDEPGPMAPLFSIFSCESTFLMRIRRVLAFFVTAGRIAIADMVAEQPRPSLIAK